MKYARLPQVVYEQLSTISLEEKTHGSTLKRIEALTGKNGIKVGYIVVETGATDHILGPQSSSTPTRFYFTRDITAAIEALNSETTIPWED